MNNLDQIKRSLFSASNLLDALAQLDALGVSYRECAMCENTYHLIVEDVTFWAARSGHSFPVHVCIGDTIATEEYRTNFFASQIGLADVQTTPQPANVDADLPEKHLFARQLPDSSKSVPAHDSPAAVEQIRIEVHLKSTPWEMFNRLFPSLAIFSHSDTEISFLSELKCRDNDPDDYVVHEPDMCIIRFSLGDAEYYSVFHQCGDVAILVGQFTSENEALDGVNLYTDNEIFQHPFKALSQVDAA